ncbi:Multidrug resistance-associated protein 1 [Cytospora mali]|uniref:Multidrug resistance-associated protein 1 n=1 Tax=Cytospora mali TaxID=578113 RepID=A0A194W1L8_CYTMA|nr:Multidrug resistance-associated protein 1 [Valsa mali]
MATEWPMKQTVSSICHNDLTLGPFVSGCRGDFDFTLLFEDIVFSIVPSACFLIMSAYRIWSIKGRPVGIGDSILRYSKLLTMFVWGALNWAILGLVIQEPLGLGTFRIASAVSSALVPPIMAWLSHMEQTRSLRTSIVINVYLFIDLLLGLIRGRTIWLVFGHRSYTILFTVATAMIAVVAILEALPKRHWQKKSMESASPEEISGLYSLLFMSWLNPLILLGNRKTLDTEDLYLLGSNLSADTQSKNFQKTWSTNGTLLFVILRSNFWSLLQPIPSRLVMLAFSFCQPFFIGRLISYLQSETPSRYTGLGLVLASFFIYTGLALSTSTFWWLYFRALRKVRSALITAIFQKAANINPGHLNTSVLTLMSTDVQRITDGMNPLHDLWANTIEVVLAAWLLQRQLGAAFVAPVLVVVACVLSTSAVSRFTGPAMAKWTKRTENRVTLTNAVISNMKSLKVSGLAGSATGSLQKSRDDEQRVASTFRFILISSVASAFTPHFISPVATFFCAGRQLDMAEVFASLSYLTLVTSPLSQLFQRIPSILASFTSFKRIQDFLEQEPRSDYRVFDAFWGGCRDVEGVAISLKGASVGWTRDEWQLSGLNLSIPRSQLTIITGPVAAGKSTLCKALLGEVPFTEGIIQFHIKHSRIGYCDQTPFLTGGTVRSNIIGFEPFDGQLYDEILETVMFKDDLQGLPRADDTEIGSEGVTLSGGQRQRVALARALYLSTDIYILDDSTVGLDRPTADEIVRRLFGPGGLLRRRNATVVWCTHSLQYLRHAEQVIMLDAEGRIMSQGGPEKGLDDSGPTSVTYQDDDSDDTTSDEKPILRKDFTMDGPQSTKHRDEQDPTRNQNDASVYAYYFGCFGPFVIFAVISTATMFTISWNFGAIWLNYWADNTFHVPGPLRHINTFYLGIYAVMQLSGIIAMGLYIASTDLGMGRVGGTVLHSKAVIALMAAPLRYFTKTDQGVTVNLFSQDINLLDVSLPRALSNTVLSAFTSLGQAVIIAIGTPFIAIGYPILGSVISTIAKAYLRTSRQLRLLDLENKSPLYAQFHDTVRGVVSIRAFGWVGSYTAQTHKYLDDSQRPVYLLEMIQVWLALVLNLIVAVLAVSATMLETHLSSITERAGFVGAGLVSLMQFGGLLNGSVQSWIYLETSLGAVKRLKDFGEKTGTESKLGEDLRPGENWPERGEIVLDGVDASYEEDKYQDDEDDKHLVLKHIHMHVHPGEKVAIIGRTGSGKSSLILLLLRLLDPTHESLDKITIDDLPLCRINRETLRQRIIAMPQEMVFLAAGETYKDALDPYSKANEEECKSALQKVGLWNVIENAGGLHAETDKDALSQGQKQLFNLAVAVLRSSLRRKAGRQCGILLLDEVTSTVDNETEMTIMQVIEEAFRGYTVVAVTHRHESVTGFDKVFVMADGKIIKDGSPHEFMKNGGNNTAEG